MTGSSLAALPALITRPHKAHTVPPPSFFAALRFAGRSPLFCWRGIDTESSIGDRMDGKIPGLFEHFG
ncbi:MAG: hypothetical protein DME63_07440 [Verrucomicrobia bacterium]|nr:MAG: hypothetical protein DME63_07440 [Verrucomicrobiota bacterium]